MPADADLPLLERFRETIAARMGLTFDETRQGELRSILNERAHACRLSSQQYVEQLAEAPAELPELARLLTVPETYFFRNRDQLDACMEHAVPACLALRGGKGIRILSAACASGEEPYTLAILLRERWPAYASAASIRGVDLNPTVLARARRARYSAWSLRETPPELKARYFSADGADFALDPEIRDAVEFEQMNLVSPAPGQLLDGSFEIVFCRNALMYFTPEQFARAVARFARVLVPGGFFFLGHAETLRGVSHDYHLCHSNNAFYYQRKQSGARTSLPPPLRRSIVPSTTPNPVVDPPADDAVWFDAITRSSDRISSLLEKEQFTQALSLLQSAPTDRNDPDRMLLEAVVSAHAGRFSEARELCGVILELDELNAGAQYVLGLCHEHHGDGERAIYHYQLSAYLDPSFAMPRVHMGLLHRRTGDTEAANRELREARRLLEREDASRLLLFGGGFGRPVLLALCDAELTPGAREVR